MRSLGAILLLVLVSACTEYQPVEWRGQGSWDNARTQANLRRTMPDDLQSFLTSTSRRPIVGRGAAGQGRHLIVPGETLSGLSQRYGLAMPKLAAANGLKPPYRVYAGQVLVLPAEAQIGPKEPRAGRIIADASAAPKPKLRTPRRVVVAEAEVDPAPAVEPARIARHAPAMTAADLEATRRASATVAPPLSDAGFMWPARGSLADLFGERSNGARNDGINILAPAGTPVVAAESGVVVYAGEDIPSFGKMLLIRHAEGFTTTYAHNGALLVGVGDVVARGQLVATVGQTGEVTQPQLHFQLRAGTDPVDPIAYLDRTATKVASTR